MEDLQLNIQIENLIKSRAELNQLLINLLREVDALNKSGKAENEEKCRRLFLKSVSN